MAGKGKGGRKRMAPHLKVVKGSRDRTTKAAPKASGDRPSAPSILSEEGVEHFERICAHLEKMKNICPEFGEIITTIAITCQEIEELTEQIEEVGLIYKCQQPRGGGVLIKANPAVGMRRAALRQLQSLLAEVHLTPASFLKMEGGEEENPFKDLLGL